MKNRPVYISGGQRTPFAKSLTSYIDVTMQELMSASLNSLVKKYHLEDKILGDVALGGVMLGPMNWNLARECVLGSKLHPFTPGYNTQRACGTSLENVWQTSLKIANGDMDVAIAGGVDTNSDLPILLSKNLSKKLIHLNAAKSFGEKLKIIASLRPGDLKPLSPAVQEPRTGKSMGEHCELMVQEWGISREEQDALSLKSHQTAEKAYQEGFYDDLVFEFHGLKKDKTLRADTTMEKLAKLKPAFDFTGKGTLTAGNSSPLTDGSATVLVTSEEGAKLMNIPILARFVDCEVAAVDFVHGDGLLMAPTIAVGRMLQRNNLKLQDFDYYEIHEAFAGQVLCTLKAWESDSYCKKYLHVNQALGPIDRSKINIKGGSVALGHPFGATGARITADLAKMLSQSKKGRGLISICTAGGMGITAILEAV
jgi:acetyl-CoA C-acetyltransferase